MAEFSYVSGPQSLPASLRGSVVAIGNFDGVHRGHQAVLRRALEQARRLGLPALALTFEPHPRKIFRPDMPLFVLTPPSMKAKLLARLGFSGLIVQPFTREFAALSPEVFIRDTLERDIGIRHAVTGFNFHFGKDRLGGPAYLMEAGDRYGFGVTLVDAFRDESANVVSSSRIRALLAVGEPVAAAALLGYRFTVEGQVIAGEKLGRTLDFPTANMRLAPETGLKEGIYAVRLRRADGTLHDGVASYGRRPTVNTDGLPLLETFLFDFSGDLYGEVCDVSFFGYLRGEEKFDGLDALVAQMRRDEAEARALLDGVSPLSKLDSKIAF